MLNDSRSNARLQALHPKFVMSQAHTYSHIDLSLALYKLTRSDPAIEWLYKTKHQLSFISDRENGEFEDGIGNLYKGPSDPEGYKYVVPRTPRIFIETYEHIRRVAKTLDIKLGRMRIMRQQPKSCLSLHQDYDEIRFHIPMRTNESVFFVAGHSKVDLEVHYMHTEGQLYSLRTDVFHTVVNASLTEDRVHLVIDGHLQDESK